MPQPYLERINAGEFDRLISLVEKVQVPNVPDDGSTTDQNVYLATNIPARYRPLRGNERQYGADGNSMAQVEFAIRFAHNLPISPKYFIEYNGDEFDIFEALPNDNRTVYLIQAKARDLMTGAASQ